jgi:phage tail sheath protein FI
MSGGRMAKKNQGKKDKGKKKPSGTYLSPGVYMEEVSSGSKPIEAVGTSVAAMIAFPRRHPWATAVAAVVVLCAWAAASRART